MIDLRPPKALKSLEGLGPYKCGSIRVIYHINKEVSIDLFFKEHLEFWKPPNIGVHKVQVEIAEKCPQVPCNSEKKWKFREKVR